MKKQKADKIKHSLIFLVALIAMQAKTNFAFAGKENVGKEEGHSNSSGSSSSSASVINFSMPGISASDFFAQTRKQIAFSPLLSVNTNRGHFETEISLKLPPSLSGFQDLRLTYNSHNPNNLGMGIGWSWNLPQIQKSNTVTGNAPYQTQGLLGHAELIATGESTSSVSELTKLILNKAAGSTVVIQNLKAYRPAVDGQGLLFLQATASGTNFWVVLSPKGDRWVLTENGQPVLYLNKSKQSVRFEWENGQLSQISSLEKTWSARVQYTGLKQAFPRLIAGTWQHLPLGLEAIEYSGKKILFQNLNGQLTKAWISGGLLPLFSGSYLPNQNIIESNGLTNSLTESDKKEIYQANRTEEVEIIKKNDDEIYMDLNGDGRSDRVTIGYSAATDRIQEFLKNNQKNQCMDLRDYADELSNNLNVSVKVEIAQANSPAEKSSFVEDSSYPIQKLLFENKLRLLRLYISCDAKKTTPVVLRPGFLQFIDLNRDGLKDILYVPFEEKFKDEKHLFAKQALAELGKSEKPSINPFQFEGGPAVVFMQGYNTEALKEKWQILEKTSLPEPTVNALTGYSKWTVIKNTGLNLHQESQILELNGQLAILTGRSLYFIGNLLSNDPTEYSKVISVDPMNFVSKETSFVTDSKKDVGVIQISSEGFLRISNLRWTRSNPLNSKLELFANGTTIRIQAGSHPMLSQIQSEFGGDVQIRYGAQDGAWVVKEIVQDPKNQPKSLRSFLYKTSMWDAHRGFFLGFADTYETSSLLDDKWSHFVQSTNRRRQYATDISPAISLYQSRARFNGRLLREQIWSNTNQILKETLNRDLVLKHLDANRVWPIDAMTETRQFNGNEISQRYTRTNQILSWLQRNGMDIMPNQIAIREEGKGFRSIHNDSLTEGVRTEITTSHFSDANYLLNVDRIETLGSQDTQIKALQTYVYDDSDTYVLQISEGKRSNSYAYDSFGRLTGHKSHLGAITRWSFSGSAALPSSVTEEKGQFQFEWNPTTGNLQTMQTPKNIQYTWQHSPDGVLVGFQKTDSKGTTNLHSLKVDTKTLTVMEETLDRMTTHHTDGFGRVIESQSWIGGRLVSDGQKTLTADGLIIAQDMPSVVGEPPQGQLMTNEINSLGQITKTIFPNGDIISTSDDGACVQTLKNQWISEATCRTGVGNIVSQTIGNEELLIDSTAEGDILGIAALGMQFNHNQYQEVTSNQSHFWSNEQRLISENGDVVVGPEGLTVHKDQYGHEIQTSRTGLKQSGDVYAKSIYSAGLLGNRSILDANGAEIYSARFQYDNEDRVVFSEQGPVQSYSTYDAFGRLVYESTELKSNGQTKVSLTYSYQNGELTGIAPIVRKVKKDVFGNLTEFQYTNGSSVRRSFEPGTHRLVGIQFLNAEGKSLYQENIKIKNLKVVERSELSPLNQWSESFEYNQDNYQLLSDSAAPSFTRDGLGQLPSLKDVEYSYRDRNLVSASTKTQSSFYFYDHNGSVIGACLTPKLKISTKDCINKISANQYLVQGEMVSLIKFEGIPVAVSIGSSVYPIVSDHLGSIKALISPDGSEILVHRHYDAWGRKTVAFATSSPNPIASALEQKIPWSYAGLVELTFGDGLYWSESRVYNPNIQEWMTADPLVRWNATELADKPGNYFPFRYAGNDPNGATDPLGRNIWLIIDREGAGGNGHAATLVGNPADGYVVVSQGAGAGSGNIILGSRTEGVGFYFGKTPTEAIQNSHMKDPYQIYDQAIEFETAPVQDREVIKKALAREKEDQKYSPFFNNCGHFSKDILQDAGINTDSSVRPNDYFDNVLSRYPKNNPSDITPQGVIK